MNRGFKDKFKHNLVPTKENNFHPRFFHIEIFSVFLILAIALQAFVYSGITSRIISAFPSLTNLAAVLPAILAAETNEYRLAQKTTPLRHNDLLAQAAQMKAEDMLKRQYFAHVDPDGDKPWKWLAKVGYSYSYAGENLAVDFIDSSDVTDAWIKSSTHRANLVNNNFSEIGIGTASGMFEGNSTTFVVQFFAKPTSASKTIMLAAGTNVKESPKGTTNKIVPNLATTSTSTDILAMYTATSASSSVNSIDGQVLGIQSNVDRANLSGDVDASSLMGSVLYSSKRISITAIETLIIFVIFGLLFSVTYSIAHHPDPRFLARVRLGIISHKKSFLHTLVFVLILSVVLIAFMSTGDTVKI